MSGTRLFFCLTTYGIAMKYQKLQTNDAAPDGARDIDVTRRKIVQGATLAAGTGLLGLATGGAWAAGSDKPENRRSGSASSR